MDKIIFRGKRLDNQQWIEGYLMAEDVINMHVVDPETIGQYTGLYDKNGVMIFEGDIVKGALSFGLPINSHVSFLEGSFGIITETHGAHRFTAFSSICNTEYEVTGNIYDNPQHPMGRDR